jgi:hypothetical protein
LSRKRIWKSRQKHIRLSIMTGAKIIFDQMSESLAKGHSLESVTNLIFFFPPWS